MRQWKANEINFYDVCLMFLAEKGTHIAMLTEKLESFAGRLRQKFYSMDIEGSEKSKSCKEKTRKCG